MRNATIILQAFVAALLVACGSSDVVAPNAQKASVRFYNGNVQSAGITMNDKELFATTNSGDVGARQTIDPTTDTVQLRAVDGPTNAILARRNVIIKPTNYSVVLFPATSAFNCVRRPEECVLHEDATAPPAGRTRIRVINATTDASRLSLSIDEMDVLKENQLSVCSISNVIDIEGGDHNIRLLHTGSEQYAVAYRDVDLRSGTTYTLLLTGSLAFDDKQPFRARLYADDEEAEKGVDLLIPPDVGKYQIVNAVAGLKSFEAKLDGVARPETATIEFSKTSGYVDLEIGTHTTGIFINSTPLIQETRTTTTLRSRKTLFVTGSMVPPNIAGIELVDLVEPLTSNSATIRFVNLSPDAPELDFYRIVNGVEAIIDGCAKMAFRETTSTANGKLHFTELPAGRITILAKKANTQTIVLPPTQISLVPGEISTYWLGGVSAAAQLYHVKHK
ncbi:MAG: DUF4397 domain-containing protein [Ignavibacteria bacterium]|nr:DUF4397 domain-containing protein [Ignavibacteria bacterium]